MRGMVFRKTPPIKFEIQLKCHTALKAPLFFVQSQPNLHCLLFICGDQALRIFRKIIGNDAEIQPKKTIAFPVKDNLWPIANKMTPFVLYSLRGQCMNFKHPSNGLQVPLFMTDRNQPEPFITHARRRSLSLKEDFFIGSRVTDDKEEKFPKLLTCRNYNCYICSAFVAGTSFEFSGKPLQP